MREQASAPSAEMAPRVVPFPSVIGAELLGIDIARGVDEPSLSIVVEALHKHGVIVIRRQELLPRDHIAFARRFGNIRTSFYNRYAVPGYPELTVVSNKKRQGEAIGIADAGMLWHSDGSYLKTPDMYSFLHGIEIPRLDGKPLGETWFTSAAHAWDALPAEMKKRVAPLRACHSFEHHLRKKENAGTLKRAPLDEAQKATLTDVEHPVVRTHPVTGRKCLYVTEGHTKCIVGMPATESDSLLHALWKHIKRPDFHYHHSWCEGDFVIWDNCAVQHLAIFDYGDVPRRLHRIGTVGGVPQ